MIEGHGDDAYRYGDIKSDFSSNICAHNHHQTLMKHLMAHPELISHYPEPEAWSLETIIAERYGLHPQQVIVTSGATILLRLIKRCSGCATPTILQVKFMRHHILSRWWQNTIW